MNHPSAPRILVVDDNRTNRVLLGRSLEAKGYAVVEAESGREALEMLEGTLDQPSHEPPGPEGVDLVLLDIMMPGMDGGEVLAELRKRKSRSELPVIMVTAMDAPDDIVEALKAGANDYVTKPISLLVVMARVETHLALRSTHRALKEAQQSVIRAAKMESIGYLAAGVAHEIRNPLARIKMALPLLERNEAVAANPKLVETVGMIRASLEKADTVVKGLMKFSQEERLSIKSQEVHPVIVDSLAMLGSEFEAVGIEVSAELEESLPEAMIAAPELSQVLVSVFLNAIQAMEGGGSLLVRTRLKAADGVPPDEGARSGNRIRHGDQAVTIEICDNGPGLTDEQLLKVFDAFYTTKPADVATGMGLTIARKIIELHGGILELAKREDGPGLRVSILLRQAGLFQTSV